MKSRGHIYRKVYGKHHYAVIDRHGHIKAIVSRSKSSIADRRIHSRHVPRHAGQGQLGDYPRRRIRHHTRHHKRHHRTMSKSGINELMYY